MAVRLKSEHPGRFPIVPASALSRVADSESDQPVLLDHERTIVEIRKSPRQGVALLVPFLPHSAP